MRHLPARFEAWRRKAPAALVLRVWPLAWFGCPLLPRPPQEMLLAPTPEIDRVQVKRALMAIGFSHEEALRRSIDTNSKLSGYRRDESGEGYRWNGGAYDRNTARAATAGDKYFERYFVAFTNAATPRRGATS